jgi:hypothetical protein
MEFKAEKDKDGNLTVKAIAERKGKDLIIHLPSLSLIKKLKLEGEKEKQNGVRDIQ